MKYWSDIVKATLYKLGIEENDDDSDEFTDKMPIIANECLSMIANDIKAHIKTITINVEKEAVGVIMPEDFLAFADTDIIFNGKELSRFNPDIIYSAWNQIILKTPGTYIISYNARYGEIPSEIIEHNTKAYKTFDLRKSYTKEQYEEFFPDSDTEFNGIYESVLDCLPTYIASQLLAQDDVQKSTILRNEFEVLTQRLETKELFQNRHFHSEGGWY